MATRTLLLTRSDVRRTLDMPDCIEAIERAFRLHGTGEAAPPAVASVHVPGGGFHMKGGTLTVDGRAIFVSKTNANFPGNPARHGLPTVQGTIAVFDAECGVPLALLDSIEVTAMRTAAATAAATRHLAAPRASSLAIIGCGLQGAQHASALLLVRQFTRVSLFDLDERATQRLAGTLQAAGVATVVAGSPAAAARDADVIVTCTPSTAFLLGEDDVRPGAFVAGVGVDAEHKRELAPGLLSRGKVVVDVLAQCAAFGDLHHALAAGVMSPAGVHAELGVIVAGLKPGRESSEEVIVFDSTGMALQDAAAAAIVYERAAARGLGRTVDLLA